MESSDKKVSHHRFFFSSLRSVTILHIEQKHWTKTIIGQETWDHVEQAQEALHRDQEVLQGESSGHHEHQQVNERTFARSVSQCTFTRVERVQSSKSKHTNSTRERERDRVTETENGKCTFSMLHSVICIRLFFSLAQKSKLIKCIFFFLSLFWISIGRTNKQIKF